MVRRKLSVLLPFAAALLSMLPACLPPAPGPRASIQSAGPEAVAPPASATAAPAPVADRAAARPHELSAASAESAGPQTVTPSAAVTATPATLPDQALAREHELSAALQALVEERTREVQRLRIEIKQLRQSEADLQAALDRTRVATDAARAAAARSEASAADTTAQTPADTGGATNFTPAPATVGQTAHDIEHQHVVEIAHLQKALAAEQQRRHQVETELSRLQQETSSPPYGTPHPGEAELTAAKRQVTELRTALDQERAARERLAAEFRALQQRADAESTDIQSASTENAELRSQLKQLEEDKQKITESFNHSLAESEQRAAELERQLAQAHSTEGPNAASDGEINDIRAENSALRARLDEEHRRTEDLAAKLKTAIRVTDLIFKMRAQSAAPASRQPQIRNRPAGR